MPVLKSPLEFIGIARVISVGVVKSVVDPPLIGRLRNRKLIRIIFNPVNIVASVYSRLMHVFLILVKSFPILSPIEFITNGFVPNKHTITLQAFNLVSLFVSTIATNKTATT